MFWFESLQPLLQCLLHSGKHRTKKAAYQAVDHFDITPASAPHAARNYSYTST